MNELALFAGAGGGILGGKLLGWQTVCAVERDPYARDVLVARQNDGCLAPFPIWDDVCTFDGRPWRGIVDVVSGGFPCQDISVAGRGKGIQGERSGLWREFARIICEVQPRFAFVENSPALTSRGLGTVLGDLASMGYDAQWGVLGADDAGAPHERKRIWIVAYTSREHSRGLPIGTEAEYSRPTQCGEDVPHTGAKRHWASKEEIRTRGDAAELGGKTLPNSNGKWEPQSQGGQFQERRRTEHVREKIPNPNSSGRETGRSEMSSEWQAKKPMHGDGGEHGGWHDWWAAEPDVGRMAYGVAARVDRLRCLGNGQVPAVAAIAHQTLISSLASLYDPAADA